MVALMVLTKLLQTEAICGNVASTLLPVLEKKISDEQSVECTLATLIALDANRETLLRATRVLPLAMSEKGLVLDPARLERERTAARDRLRRSVDTTISKACGEPEVRLKVQLQALLSSIDAVRSEIRNTGVYNPGVFQALERKMPGPELVPWVLRSVGSAALTQVPRGHRAVFSLDSSSIDQAAWSAYTEESKALRELLPSMSDRESSGFQVVIPSVEAIKQVGEPSTLRLVVNRDNDGMRWHCHVYGLGPDDLVIESAAYELKANLDPQIPTEWFQDGQVLQRPVPEAGKRDPLADRFADWLVALAKVKNLQVIGVVPDSVYALQDQLPRTPKVSDLAKALRDLSCVDIVVKDGWMEVVPILPLEEAKLYIPRAHLDRLGLAARDGVVPVTTLISELGGRTWHPGASIFRSLRDAKGKTVRLPVGADPAGVQLLWTAKAHEPGFRTREVEVRSMNNPAKAALESVIIGETHEPPLPGRRLRLIQRADPDGRLTLSRSTTASFTFTLIDGGSLQLSGNDVLALRNNRSGASEEGGIAWRKHISTKLYKSVTWRQYESFEVSYVEPPGLKINRGIRSASRELEAKDLNLLPKDVWGSQ